MKTIPVTKPFLPSRENLDRYIDGIYERNWLTNNGELVQELARRLEAYLGVENLLLVANGTLALQIAYRALGVGGHAGGERQEAITTPFSFVATASSLKWEGIEPVFADIDPDTWCLDPANIEPAITSDTRAIVPVHVFGNACDVEAIDAISHRHGLKVIYDGAHAFGVKYKGKSLLNYGDATTLSFHATKLFHTAEGGAIIFRRKPDFDRAKMLINFGITGPESIEMLGVNAKMNEFQAAIGLCVLDEIEENLRGRERVWTAYEKALRDRVQLQQRRGQATNNYAYFPLALESEVGVKQMMRKLELHGISTRRYFYPALDYVAYMRQPKPLPNSSDIARRILCLPIYSELDPGLVIDVL